MDTECPTNRLKLVTFARISTSGLGFFSGPTKKQSCEKKKLLIAESVNAPLQKTHSFCRNIRKKDHLKNSATETKPTNIKLWNICFEMFYCSSFLTFYKSTGTFLNFCCQFTGNNVFVLGSITVQDKELQENKLVDSNQVLVQTNE